MSVPSVTPFKACTKCGATKPFTLQFFRAKNKDALRPDCRVCSALRDRAYKAGNAEVIRLRNKEYHAANRQEQLRKRREYHAANREHLNECSERYWKEHRERLIELKREQYDVVENREQARRWRAENPEKARALQRRLQQQRRARLRAVECSFSAAEWRECVAAFGERCAYCRSKVELTQDHVVPLVNGGGYVASNIIPACRSCNCSKHARSLEDWYTQQSFYTATNMTRIVNYLEVV